MNFFADSVPGPDPVHFYQVVKSLGMLVSLTLSGATLVVLLTQRHRPQKRILEPQPIQVEEAPRFVTVEGWETARQEIERRVALVEGEVHSFRTERKSELGVLYDRISELREHSAALRRETEMQNQRLCAIEADIKTLLKRV